MISPITYRKISQLLTKGNIPIPLLDGWDEIKHRSQQKGVKALKEATVTAMIPVESKFSFTKSFRYLKWRNRTL